MHYALEKRINAYPLSLLDKNFLAPYNPINTHDDKEGIRNLIREAAVGASCREETIFPLWSDE
jgi:hypothetical protein